MKISYLFFGMMTISMLLFGIVSCLQADRRLVLLNSFFSKPEDVRKLFSEKSFELEDWAKIAKYDFDKIINKILSAKPELSNYKNSFGALDDACRRFDAVVASLHLQEMVDPHAKKRDKAREKVVELKAFYVDKIFNKALYKVLVDYSLRQQQGLVDANLSNEKLYYIKHFLQSLKIEGIALEDQQFVRFKELQNELTALGMEFSKNINTISTILKFTKDQLEGTGHAWQSGLVFKDELYEIALNHPNYIEIMENCRVAKTRQTMFKAHNLRAWPENEQLFNKILELRAEKAKLLGFGNYAELDMCLMMAKNPTQVNNFLNDLQVLAKPKMECELKLWQRDLPDGVELDEQGRFYLWDLGFVKEQYRKTHLNLDEQLIRQYFPLKATIEGLFGVYQKLLGVTFILHEEVDLWFDGLKTVEIRDNETNQIKGFVLLDLHPRANKYSHACMVPLLSAINYGDKVKPAVCAVVANLPEGNELEPALLKLDDVRTFFHEFGHAMHMVLGATETSYFSGTNVLHDFVETPSMMFEEWLWQPEILTMISQHYQTGDSLPDEVVEKIVKNRSFDTGCWTARQINFAKYSVACHSSKDGKVDLRQLWQELCGEIMPGLNHTDFDTMHASWGHLTGYASKYYTYLWSLVFACDLFEHINQIGLNTVKAGELVQKLLSTGGSIAPDELLKMILNRSASADAMARRKGLGQNKNN